ncbi:MAG: hypothetical protein ACREF9_18370, partial [Opitutaceae bacterium]
SRLATTTLIVFAVLVSVTRIPGATAPAALARRLIVRIAASHLLEFLRSQFAHHRSPYAWFIECFQNASDLRTRTHLLPRWKYRRQIKHRSAQRPCSIAIGIAAWIDIPINHDTERRTTRALSGRIVAAPPSRRVIDFR